VAETFSVGDTVSTSLAGLAKGTIAFGPFRNTPTGDERYMVQAEDGTAHSVVAADIRPLVLFTVGEKVTETTNAETVEVMAGPFAASFGRQRYVIKRRNGLHAFVVDSSLKRPDVRTLQDSVRRAMEGLAAAAAGASVQRFYTFRGRTYDLKAEYTDRQGDVWKFNGQTDRDGMPLMDCPLHPSLGDYRLSTVLNNYGPLHRA
jgi:hypothetical protein